MKSATCVLQSFRLAKLPTGQTINVSAQVDTDGGDRTAREPNMVPLDEVSFGSSTQRIAYQGDMHEEWQAGNTAR